MCSKNKDINTVCDIRIIIYNTGERKWREKERNKSQQWDILSLLCYQLFIQSKMVSSSSLNHLLLTTYSMQISSLNFPYIFLICSYLQSGDSSWVNQMLPQSTGASWEIPFCNVQYMYANEFIQQANLFIRFMYYASLILPARSRGVSVDGVHFLETG